MAPRPQKCDDLAWWYGDRWEKISEYLRAMEAAAPAGVGAATLCHTCCHRRNDAAVRLQ